jgi:hypothetical protein
MELGVERGRVAVGFSAGPITGIVGHRPLTAKGKEVSTMLYTIAVVLIILWLLGLVSSYTLGGFIHILLVVAIVMVLVNLITGRRAL